MKLIVLVIILLTSSLLYSEDVYKCPHPDKNVHLFQFITDKKKLYEGCVLQLKDDWMCPVNDKGGYLPETDPKKIHSGCINNTAYQEKLKHGGYVYQCKQEDGSTEFTTNRHKYNPETCTKIKRNSLKSTPVPTFSADEVNQYQKLKQKAERRKQLVKQSGQQEHSTDNQNQQQCEHVKKKLKELTAHMREGYRASQANSLNSSKRYYQKQIYENCR